MRVNQPQVAAWLLEQFGDPRMAQRALEAKLSGAGLARPEDGLKDALQVRIRGTSYTL